MIKFPNDRRKYVQAALIFGLVYGLASIPVVQTFFYQAASPVIRPAKKAGRSIAYFVTTVANIGRLAAENSRLKGELSALYGSLATAEELKAENEILKNQLEVTELKGSRLLPARILLTANRSFDEEIVLDKGEKAGVKKGMVVVFEDNLIGRIIETGPDDSRLRLLLSPDSTVLGTIKSRGATGAVRGKLGSGILGLDEIELGKKIEVGDLVTSVRSSLEVPAGLAIGVVEEIDRRDNAVFQSAKLRPTLDYAELDIVFIVLRAN